MEVLAAVTDRPGYLVVDVPGKGPHHFRLPPASRAQRIGDLYRERTGSGTALMYEAAGAMVGAAWRHETLELEAVFPETPTTSSLVAYSEAVQLELEEAGYSEIDLATMGSALSRAVIARLGERVEAKDLAGFSGPAKDEKTSRKSNSASSSRGTPKPSSPGREKRA